MWPKQFAVTYTAEQAMLPEKVPSEEPTPSRTGIISHSGDTQGNRAGKDQQRFSRAQNINGVYPQVNANEVDANARPRASLEANTRGASSPWKRDP